MKSEQSPLNTIDGIQSWLTKNYVCPVDYSPLERVGNWYVSQSNPERRYPIVGNIPVFLRDDIEHTSWRSKESLEHAQQIADGLMPMPVSKWDGSGVHTHVQGIIHSTGGHLYNQSRGKLKDYPIPRIRVEKGHKNRTPDRPLSRAGEPASRHFDCRYTKRRKKYRSARRYSNVGG